MPIEVKSLTTHKIDVKYHFSDGTRLIHDSKRYYIGKKAPENEVDINLQYISRAEPIVKYKFRNRGSEPSTTVDDEEYYTHPYGGRTEIPRTGLPRLGWSITDGRTTTYGAGTSSEYTTAQRNLNRGETISRSASTTKITHTNSKWTEWNDKGVSGTTHTKEPETTQDFIRKETRAGRR